MERTGSDRGQPLLRNAGYRRRQQAERGNARFGNNVPVGAARSPNNSYRSYEYPPTELVTIISTDGGATWRLTESSDYE